MYKYKYVLTMLAMFCFNLSIASYLMTDGSVAAVTFLGCGYVLLVAKVYLIIKNEKLAGLKEQAKQWLLEIALFSGLVGYTVGANSPLYCAILLVTSVCGVCVFIGFALHSEMSKL